MHSRPSPGDEQRALPTHSRKLPTVASVRSRQNVADAVLPATSIIPLGQPVDFAVSTFFSLPPQADSASDETTARAKAERATMAG